MHWILQNNLFQEEAYQTLLDTLQRWDIPYSIHKVIPVIGKLTEPRAPHVHGPVICMGSYSLRHAARKHRWKPGVFDLEGLEFEVQKKHWGTELLNFNSQLVRFEDVRFEGLKFLRPEADTKVFAGKVYDWEEFHEWQHKVCVLEDDFGTSLTKDTIVQVADPTEIYAEYRFWIVKGNIATASLYKRGDRVIYRPEVDERFFEYVRFVLQKWMPLETFVLDVCETPLGLRIVEPNTLNSAGFYAADVQALVYALEQSYNVPGAEASP